MANKKIFVYDFDETLCLFQTPDEFIEYCISESFFRRLLSVFVLNLFIVRLARAFGFSKKKLLLLTMCGMRENEILCKAKDFYEIKIKPKLNVKVLERLLKDSEDGDIIILSGGFKVYIQFFCSEYSVEYLEANDFKVKSSRILGILLGRDCVGAEKVVRLINILDKDLFTYDITSYSDCFSDQPLFDVSNSVYLVSGQRISQIK